MAIQYTSPYNLPYPQIGDPVKEGQANMELLAKRVNTVLTDGSFPASNPDVASITARLNELEKGMETQIVEYTSTVAASSQAVTQSGSLAYQAGGSAITTGSWITSGSGQVTINETGIYGFTYQVGFVNPVSGRSFIEISVTGISQAYRISVGGSEDTAISSIAGIRIAAGTVVKFQIYQSSGGTITANSRVHITRHRKL